LSFCSLVQRVSRAGRDFASDAEAILIVSSTVAKEGISDGIIEEILAGAALDAETQETAEATSEGCVEVLDSEGTRFTEIDDSEPDDEPAMDLHEQKQKRRKISKDINIHEAQALSTFITTKDCRRRVWDLFFNNMKKRRSSAIHI